MRSVTEIQADIERYQAAEGAVLLGGQVQTAGEVSLTRGDLRAIQARLRELRTELAMVRGGGRLAGGPARLGVQR